MKHKYPLILFLALSLLVWVYLWLRHSWDESAKGFKNGLFLSQIPPGSSFLKVYIWNIDNVPFRIENGVVELFVLIDHNDLSDNPETIILHDHRIDTIWNRVHVNILL